MNGRTDGRTVGVIERTEGYMEVWSNKPIERLRKKKLSISFSLLLTVSEFGPNQNSSSHVMCSMMLLKNATNGYLWFFFVPS